MYKEPTVIRVLRSLITLLQRYVYRAAPDASAAEADATEYLDNETARNQLAVDAATFAGLARSGLLGPHDGIRFRASAVRDLLAYGTQWDGALQRGIDAIQWPIDQLGGEQPPGTISQIPISLTPDFDAADRDTQWIVQLYIRPNHSFFPDPHGFALIGPIGLRLDNKFSITVKDHTVRMFPDPSGTLALLHVSGAGRPSGDTIGRAQELVAPTLDAISFLYDHPIHIAHSVLISLPSGIVTIELPKPAAPATLQPGHFQMHPRIRAAHALYREGISSANPFHQFLTLWKCWENVGSERAQWRRETRGRPVQMIREVLPPMFAWRTYVGMSFDEVAQQLRGPYRVALAHGDVDQGRPLTMASAADIEAVQTKIPTIRYMARTRLINFANNLKSQP